MKTCRLCKKSFEIFPEDRKFYEKIQTPEPTLCPECRRLNLMCFRNERTFYPGKCRRCGASMISCFSPDTPLTIWCNDCWWSDAFDAKNYGRDFDFSRPFFDQFWELMKATPIGNLFIATSENSEYSNFSVGNKNCYMLAASDYNEDSFFADNSNYNRDVGDVSFVNKSELLYESIDAQNSYMCAHSQNLKNCNFCWFCADCIGCSNCIGCVGLRNAQYHIFNKPVSKEQFETAVKNLSSFRGIQKMTEDFRQFLLTQPRRFSNNINAENCTGDYITNSKNCFQCFDIQECDGCRYVVFGYKSRDVMDSYGAPSDELSYQVAGVVECYHMEFCCLAWPGSSDVSYSLMTRTAKNCFGCVSLRGNEYCILNKQYNRPSFDKLRMTIIEHMKKTGEYGEFFPMQYSPWAYNETVAQDFFPKSKEEILNLGARCEESLPGTHGKGTLSAEKIPDDIMSVPDKIIEEILTCISCGKNYRIIKQELGFYRKLKMPLPRTCSTCRYRERVNLRNPRILQNRPCSLCNKSVETTYPPLLLGKVFCETCYQRAF